MVPHLRGLFPAPRAALTRLNSTSEENYEKGEAGEAGGTNGRLYRFSVYTGVSP